MRMVSTQNKFSIFIPIEFEKSGKTGEQRYDNMRIKGVASNPNTGKDKQGQWLDPAGFDLNDFLKSGNLNYHHLWKKSPLAIVGEPTVARITKANELYIEGTLYKDSATAREIYDLGEILEKNSKTRRLGFSIEGIPLETDPLDENKITKARITNVAITPNPINYGTRMDLIKGGLDDIEFEEESELFLIDVTDNGIRYTVDKNLVIKKSEGAPAYGGESGSASSAEEMDRVTTKESVEHGKIPTKKKKKKKDFSKAELLLEIFSLFKNIDIDSVKKIYSLSEEIQKSLTPNMAVTKVTDEAYNKALVTLGLQKAVTTASPSAAEIQKAEQDKIKEGLKTELNDALKKAEEIKAKLEGKEIAKAETTILKESEFESEIVKAFEDKIGALAIMVTKDHQEKDEIMKATGELKDSVTKLVEFNEKLAKRIGIVESQPLDRKSVTVAAVERFEKGEGDELNKGGQAGIKTLSLSNTQERAELADIVFNAALDKDGKVIDKEFAKAVTSIELRSLGSNSSEANKLANRLLKEHKVKVVK